MKLYRVTIKNSNDPLLTDDSIIIDKEVAEKRLAYLKLIDEDYELIEIDTGDVREIEQTVVSIEGIVMHGEKTIVDWMRLSPAYDDDLTDDEKVTKLTFFSDDTKPNYRYFYGTIKVDPSDNPSNQRRLIRSIILDEFDKKVKKGEAAK